jgi:hypothetical protein
MKKAIFFLTLALTMTTFFTSCTKDPVDDRADFVASWNINETYTITGWGTDTDVYIISIAKSTATTTGIIISNFANVDFVVEATVSGSSFTIDDTVIDEGDSYTVTGSGTVDGTTISFNYNIGGFWTGICTGTKM